MATMMSVSQLWTAYRSFPSPQWFTAWGSGSAPSHFYHTSEGSSGITSTLVLTASFQDSLGKPALECHMILDSTAARDDGRWQWWQPELLWQAKPSQITTINISQHSVFTSRMHFLSPNQHVSKHSVFTA